MIKKISAILPLAIFLVLIIGVGYLIWNRWANPDPPPTVPVASDSPTPPIVLLTSPTPTSVVMAATPLPSIGPTPHTNPTSPPTLTVQLTSTHTPTLITQLTSTHTPTPTQPPTPILPPRITGIVTVPNLNVRWGPGLEYGYVGAVYQGDEVLILQRTPSTDWLEVKTPDDKQGWVGAKFIGKIKGNLNGLPVALIESLPPPVAVTPTGIIPLDIEGEGVSGSINPDQERWYSFSEKDQETVFVFVFKPNFNGVQISLLDQDETYQWLIVGVGSSPASDRDGDLNTGELIWRGGPLVAGDTYYLRLVNNSPNTIEYCLMPKDEYQWDCSQD